MAGRSKSNESPVDQDAETRRADAADAGSDGKARPEDTPEDARSDDARPEAAEDAPQDERAEEEAAADDADADLTEEEPEEDWEEGWDEDAAEEDEVEEGEGRDEDAPEDEWEDEDAGEGGDDAEEMPLTATAPASPTVIRRGPGFVPLFLGGVIAAVIGFGVARYAVPQGWPFGPRADEVATLKAQVAQQAQALDSLKAALAKAQAAAADASKAATGAAQDVGTLKQTISAETETNSATIGKLQKQVDALAARPASGGGGGASSQQLAALQAKVNALQDDVTKRMEAEKQAADAAKAKAQKEATLARARGALDRIEGALDAGGGFADQLDALTSAGVQVPAALSGVSESGAPTLTDLRDSFAPAARAALQASIPATMDKSAWGRFKAFIQAQTGARSLTPRAGAGPDAILSRAEAAVKAGKLQDALTDLSGLPEAGKKQMADWVGRAQLRIDAKKAAAEVAAKLGEK